MIKHVLIRNLNGSICLDSDFHDDVNIITGRNGSGKTSVLKAIWYPIAGNMEILASEMTFQEITITGSNYKLSIVTEPDESVTVSLTDCPNAFKERFGSLEDMASSKRTVAQNPVVARATGGSLFFPTFRRIEGGFLTGGHTQYIRRLIKGRPVIERASDGGLMGPISEIENKLSVFPHKFICSISTNDLRELTGLHHSRIIEQTNVEYMQFGQMITETISKIEHQSYNHDIGNSAYTLLMQIKSQVSDMELRRKRVHEPLNILGLVIQRILKHSGIRFGETLTVGQSLNAIDSDRLSAGEKQLLGFLCYNSFHKGVPFIVDEPELSLHVDWQRQFVPILESQISGNQLILATHSPFIYSKYSDKEICINNSGDRGYTGPHVDPA